MPQTRFEPTIPLFGLSKTYAP